MGLPSSGISSTDGAPLVYVASESTALNTRFQSLESCITMKILVCIHVKWSLVGVICKFLTLGLLFLNCSGPKDHIERADLKPE